MEAGEVMRALAGLADWGLKGVAALLAVLLWFARKGYTDMEARIVVIEQQMSTHLRNEFREGIDSLRKETREDVGALRIQMEKLRSEVNTRLDTMISLMSKM